ncbi:hypothetical protein BASA81_009473 [Batrachochytrium salamandrivorans]|nr:hypothetical protein BASA81_009473 [Batrachochytrium salamandrivorans]
MCSRRSFLLETKPLIFHEMILREFGGGLIGVFERGLGIEGIVPRSTDVPPHVSLSTEMVHDCLEVAGNDVQEEGTPMSRDLPTDCDDGIEK